jgi:hypothetical protein
LLLSGEDIQMGTGDIAVSELNMTRLLVPVHSAVRTCLMSVQYIITISAYGGADLQAFAAAFRAALVNRLLHAGAATADIITTYVNTIHALKQMDASGVWLCIALERSRAYTYISHGCPVA